MEENNFNDPFLSLEIGPENTATVVQSQPPTDALPAQPPVLSTGETDANASGLHTQQPVGSFEAQIAAQMVCATIVMVGNTVGGMISGENDYSPNKQQQKDFVGVTANYIATGNFTYTPAQMFYVSLFMMFMSIGGNIVKEKRKRNKILEKSNIAKREQLAATMSAKKETESFEVNDEREKEFTQFDVDENGFYIKINNKYIKQGDRILKASKKVIEMKAKGMTNKEIKEELNK